MSDDHGEDGEGGEDTQGGPLGKLAGGAASAADGISELLGEGEETAEAREGLKAARDAAEGVKETARTVETVGRAADAVRRANVGDAAGAIGGALGNAGGGLGAAGSAIGGMVPDGEARRGLRDAGRVASQVGQVARGTGQLVDGAVDLLEELTGGPQPIELHLTIDGEEIDWTVQSVSFEDAIGRLTEATVHARCSFDAGVDEEELLGKDVHLSLERGDETRSIKGIVRHAHVSRHRENMSVRIDVTPAFWLLSQTLDSRIYQDLTVPALIEQVVGELLGGRHRTVRRELTETYPQHEYLVQYRESHWQFLARLCDEEGIFFYFDHEEGEHEILVLADSNENRPRIRDAHEGRVDFEENESRTSGRDVAYGVQRHRRIGATDAAVRGFDWTNPSLEVKHERAHRGAWSGPPLEVYDHHHAVRHHEYEEGGGQYRSHTADRHSRLHTERLDLGRQSWVIHTTVVSARPGHVFELAGSDEHDDRYLIVAVSGSASAGEHGGEIDNTLEVIPAAVPYRPPQPVRPTMPGPETAIVVGPPGEEIHTDRHGRIKVQFHWDRQGQRDERSSAWLRVSQAWAGPGWGFVFIPRIGMEVIVSFLGGDPDRPIVTGCVYNGTNTPPYPLPQEKTKSTIKTNSSLGGDGFNELRFEDKKGSEEIYIHAEKDFNEVVDNNHSTHVKNCQTNTVDVDQTETVHGEQRMTVKKERWKTIEQSEWTEITLNRTETVHGSEDVIIEGYRHHTVKLDETLLVQEGDRTVTVQAGKDEETYQGGRETTVLQFDNLTVGGGANRNEHVTGQKNVTVDGKLAVTQGGSEHLVMDGRKTHLESGKEIELKTGQSDYVLKNDGNVKLTAATKVEIEVGGCKIEMTTTSIKLMAGASAIELGPSGVTVSGPKVTSSSAGVNEITGLLVKIN